MNHSLHRPPVCLLILLLLFVSGCQQARYDAEMERLREELQESQERFEQSSANHSNQHRQLVHLVWFKLKPDLSDDQSKAFIIELNKLTGIDQVNGLEIGQFQDLGDDRAMADLDLVMRMGFDSEADYRTYQDHAIHQQLKQDIGEYLRGPPVTYDYWTAD